MLPPDCQYANANRAVSAASRHYYRLASLALHPLRLAQPHHIHVVLGFCSTARIPLLTAMYPSLPLGLHWVVLTDAALVAVCSTLLYLS